MYKFDVIEHILYGGIASNPFSLTSTLRISGLFIISGGSFKLSMIKRIFIENEFIGISKVIQISY